MTKKGSKRPIDVKLVNKGSNFDRQNYDPLTQYFNEIVHDRTIRYFS